MTPSAIGALPLGTIVTSREDEGTLKFAFSLYKTLLNERSFYGRGAVGPKIALTDDSDSERNSLQYTWPSMLLLLCLFHVLQAVWGWLWKGDHQVIKHDRPTLYNLFRSLVYSRTEEEYDNSLTVLKKDKVVDKYSNFLKHVESDYLTRKAEWALSERISKSLETHGTNTNNYVETSFRLTKENQFHRVRAYNLPDLLDTVLDDSHYYVQRCIDVGNMRLEKLVNQKSKYLFKKTNIDTSLIENLRKKMFKVDMTLGLCECAMGLSKGPCKHKHIVAKHFDVASLHTIPSDNEIMRAFYHFLWHWCS